MKLRFKADDGTEYPAWKEKTLGDITDVIGGGTPSTDVEEYWNGDIQWFTPTEIGQTKYVSKSVRTISNEGLSHSSARLLPKGAILLTTRATVGEMSIADNDCCTNQGFQSLVVNSSNDNEFVYYCQPLIKRYCLQHASGSTFVEISRKNVSKCPLSIPSLSEQRKIAALLSSVDDVITAQAAEVAAWEERKKGVMQKLFSQEVRFKADDGAEYPAWEKQSFADTFVGLNNNTFSRDCLNYGDGPAKNIHYGDILVKYGAYVDMRNTDVPFVNDDTAWGKYDKLQDGDVVIADTAEDDTAGKAVEVEGIGDLNVVAGLHTIACRPQREFSSHFLGYYLNSDAFHNQLRPFMQGIKVTSISKTNIALTSVFIPSLPEQRKIADCLSSFDEIIAKAKDELTKWQELKRGLLQQMFV